MAILSLAVNALSRFINVKLCSKN